MATHEASIPVSIPATKAHRQFGEILKRAYGGKEHFIVERDGLPVVAIISMAEYEALQQARAEKVARTQRFRELAQSIGEEYERLGLTEEEVLEQLEASRQAVYERYYGDATNE